MIVVVFISVIVVFVVFSVVLCWLSWWDVSVWWLCICLSSLFR